MSTQQAAAERLSKSLNERAYAKRGWTWWIVPRPFDLVSSALYLAVFFTYFIYGCSCQNEAWRVILLIVNIFALLLIDRLEYRAYGERTPTRPAFWLLLLRIGLIGVVTQLDSFNFSPFLFLIPPFLAYLYFKSWVSYGLAALAWMVYVARIWLTIPGWYADERAINNLLIFTVGLIFAIAMAWQVAREQASRLRAEHLLAEVEASHQQLKVYAEQVAELATTRERNRLARDIHDSLGHYLTVINVQLEKALAFRSQQPAQADTAVSDAKRLASEALQDVRRSVGTLRETRALFAFAPAAGELIERVRQQQIDVAFHSEGEEGNYSGQALIALYRVVQEGLTNVQKHAGASAVEIAVAFGASEASLVMRDNGRGFEPATLRDVQAGNAAGYGLQGLQERLELVGGTLRVESVPGKGATLFVSIPRDSAAADAINAPVSEGQGSI